MVTVKILLKYILYIVVFTTMVFFVGYIYVTVWLQQWDLHRYSYNSSPRWGKHTTDTKLLRYKIGSYYFNIPANYTFRSSNNILKNVIETSESDLVMVVWPDLAPYTENNNLKFEQEGIKDKIYLSIIKVKWYQPEGEYNPADINAYKKTNGALTPEQSFLLNVYNLKQRGIEGTYLHDQEVPSEFIYYPTIKGENEENSTLGNIYAVLDQGRYIYSARCSGFNDMRHTWLGQYCDSFLKFNDEIYIRYKFDFNLLKDWRQIESKIKTMLASFEQAAAIEKTKTVH